MSFRLVGIATDDLGDRVEAYRKREGRSLSNAVVFLVERGLGGLDEREPQRPERGSRSSSRTHKPPLDGSDPDVGSRRKVKRSVMCEHRLSPEQFCRVCDVGAEASR